jgi:hypothetical protein
MVFSTPSVIVAIGTEMTPAAAAGPAAYAAADLTVAATNENGVDADDASWARAAAKPPPESATP